MAEVLELKAASRAAGTVRLPGSKSISNRVLLLSSLAAGKTRIAGLLDADDTRVMLAALRSLGVEIAEEQGCLVVEGAGGAFPVKNAKLFLGNAGTAFRPLTAALALSRGEYELSGVPRMHERPIGDLVDGLRGIGARIDYAGKEGFPPLSISKGNLASSTSATVRGDVSSQFLTALLMALPLLGKKFSVHVEGELISKPYVEITLGVMKRFGVEVSRNGWKTFEIPSGEYKSPGTIFVEGDASSASYFLAAGALAGGPVRVEGVGRASSQGDVRFTEVLERMGAQVAISENAIEVKNEGRKLRAFDMDMNHIPDAAMTAAVLALFAEGPSSLRNIGSWRVKETDRIAAMAAELRKLGAAVEEGPDFLKIAPPARLNQGVVVKTYDDHRIAMSFALVSLGGVPVGIDDPGCVGKTFPAFFREFSRIVR
ncbi:MAG: 3-phosphoshikimate 1-carboxyvinyltransferase [Betaproteobacteria bacterium]|nr:3-phosphoshikimate 1-carboxyvinyltransferase [Betaproteobacteria bacterium]